MHYTAYKACTMRVTLFFFNDPATTEIYTLPLHDALPISWPMTSIRSRSSSAWGPADSDTGEYAEPASIASSTCSRSEEHTSELQSRQYLVCRLLLEKKKQKNAAFLLDPPCLPTHM